MNISKKKNAYDEYTLDVSYVELMSISDALGVALDSSENTEPDPVRDSLLQGIRWYAERLPLPGEEEEKKEDKESPDDTGKKIGKNDHDGEEKKMGKDDLGLPEPDDSDFLPDIDLKAKHESTSRAVLKKLTEDWEKAEPDLVSQIIAYEEGELDEESAIELFQKLIDTGTAWKLQGHYGRTAAALIQRGLCHPPKDEEPSIADELPEPDDDGRDDF